MKGNKKCLTLRGKTIIKNSHICKQCGFNTDTITNLRSHKCRPEGKEQINKIKILSDANDKLNNDIKGIKIDHSNMISSMKYDLKKKYINTIKKSEQKFNTLELENERHISDFVNLVSNTDIIINELKTELKEYKSKIFDIASKPSSVINNTEYFTKPSNIVIEEIDDLDDDDKINNDDYQLTPLELGNGYNIEFRDEDGYINVTHLCTAGKKEFSNWFQLDKTKAFLKALSSSAHIHMDELIKYSTGSNKEKSNWAHPQVAMNIAQWMSPLFDMTVSSWVYEVMMTGKVDISNTKSYRELQSENKDKQLKIQYLTKKYVKRQERTIYKDKNVVYILTTKNHKKERRYILGKAEDLTKRLSVYNKSDEFEVIYYQSCGTIENMYIVEKMIFNKLNKYIEQANRERYILPKDKDIKLFIDIIKECIKFIE